MKFCLRVASNHGLLPGFRKFNQILGSPGGAVNLVRKRGQTEKTLVLTGTLPTLTRDEATRSIPVIMCTSKNQETDRIWGMRQGAVDYVVKPVSTAQLVEKAQLALAG